METLKEKLMTLENLALSLIGLFFMAVMWGWVIVIEMYCEGGVCP